MKKIVLFLLACLLIACQKEVEPEPVIEVIPLDLEAYHNVKLKSYNNTIPHIIKTHLEMDDERYGTFSVQMYDTNYEPVWQFLWRDLDKDNGHQEADPYIYENVMVINVQGIVSVHDLVTGEFKWELETSSKDSQFVIEDDILYVLGYQEDYITGISIETGEVLIRIPDDNYLDADALSFEEDALIAYYKTSRVTRNAISFDKEGQYKKKLNYMEKKTVPATWETIETSDESLEAGVLIDGDMHTAWAESVKGYGEKEWVEITRVLPTTVTKLKIVNGNQSSEKAYNENAKLKTVILSVGDGKSFTYKFEHFEYGYVDEICFVKPVVADYLIMTIMEVEPGEVYKNTYISEIITE